MTHFAGDINASRTHSAGFAPARTPSFRPLGTRQVWRRRLQSGISLSDLFQRQSQNGGYADYNRKI